FYLCFFFSSRRRHTRSLRDWSSDVCSSDLQCASGSYAVFLVLWATLVYDPLAHWVWGADGWLFKRGALDFAGGTVVHISAGVSEIGRASCRERVKVSGGGAALKRKKIKKES